MLLATANFCPGRTHFYPGPLNRIPRNQLAEIAADKNFYPEQKTYFISFTNLSLRRPRQARSHVEKNLRAPPLRRLLHAQLMVSHRFDVRAGFVPRSLKFLAVYPPANFALPQLVHLRAAKNHLFRVGNRQNFREPVVKQRFDLAAARPDLAPLALLNIFERASKRHHRQRRVRKQFLHGCAVRDESDVCRMFDDFKGRAHAGIVSRRPRGYAPSAEKIVPANSRMIFALALIALLGAAGRPRFLHASQNSNSAAAETLPKGTVIPNVVCLANPKQSYVLYIPSNYAPDRRWPILYAFDPGAEGILPVSLARDAAELYGYIVAGSNNSRNGPQQIQLDAAKAVWQDTHSRFAIDDRRIYFTGFSGGARGATAIALACGNCVAGVIAHGAGFPSSGLPEQKISFAYFAAVGIFDFNYGELVQLKPQLDARGVTNRLRRFDGTHQWAPSPVWTEAIEWMELMAMKQGSRAKDPSFITKQMEAESKRAKAFEDSGDAYSALQEYRQAAKDFDGLGDTAKFTRRAAELERTSAAREGEKREKQELAEQQQWMSGIVNELGALRSQPADRGDIITKLRADITDLSDRRKRAKEPDEERITRRALSGILINAYESGEDALLAKDPGLALIYFEMAAEISPPSPGPEIGVARASAQAGKKKEALQALKRAIQKGIKPSEIAELLVQDESFARWKDDEDFRQLTIPSDSKQ